MAITPITPTYSEYQVILVVILIFVLLIIWIGGYLKNPSSSTDGWIEVFRDMKVKNRHVIFILLLSITWIGLSILSVIQFDSTYKIIVFLIGIGIIIIFAIKCQKYRIICGIVEIPKREEKKDDNTRAPIHLS